jgi:tRNA threonylcarbamoyladenosine biosynthesis protein TsaB
MPVLALETATTRASVLLAKDDGELAAWRETTHQDLCRRLAGEVQAVLAKADTPFADLSLVAVGLGPGSFTSLRVGLATAKAIALSHGRPLVGVSSLAAMAWPVRDRISGLLCPVLDAKRGDLYAACYRPLPDGLAPVVPEFVANPQELVDKLAAIEKPVTVFGQWGEVPVGDLTAADLGSVTIWSGEEILPDALAVAQLARRLHAERGADEIGPLHPIYVRKSYAEEKFDLDLGLR